LRREKSLPLLNPQYKSHLQASYSYSRFGHNKTRAKSGRRDDRHGRSEKRQAHSPKRRTHSIDSDLVSDLEYCVSHVHCHWNVLKSGSVVLVPSQSVMPFYATLFVVLAAK